VGRQFSETLVADAVDALLEDAAPLAHNAYKVPLLKVLVRRALAGILGVR
jgi:CO/xanthine dehydrogenase FAD-binding subunit